MSNSTRFLEGVEGNVEDLNSKSQEEKEEDISRNIDEIVEAMEKLRKAVEELEALERWNGYLNILKRTLEKSKNHLEVSKHMMESMGEQIKTARTALTKLEEVLLAKRKHLEPVNLLSICFSPFRFHNARS